MADSGAPARAPLWRRRLRRWGAWVLLLAIGSSIGSVLLLRWVDPWTSAFMVATRKDALLAGNVDFSNDYRWVDLERISPQAAIAVVAAEDQRFPFHPGFDFKSIREALRHNARSTRVRGASTISQQVAKNLFLWRGRSYLRKGLEAWFTVLIETTWPKRRILEVYLNIAEFGRGIHGVEAAAQRFFDKPAANLTPAQAATLAAVLPNPVRLRADAPSPYVRQRREQILGQMRALGGPAYLRRLD
ncbi:MAG: monofunctional biosynthetic peptidoglycan transglycosylase [Sinobacteraceae bacterium]|nr:monofunctional biosynthetic peptidoglycan transglycosylase [Nevskiaceae bacterium]